MNVLGFILLSMALVLFAILINYRFWEDGRFAILKTTSISVIFFGLITFGSVCSGLIDYNKLGFIWTVFGSSVTIVALAWSLSTQLTISDELEKLRTEYLRLNNNHCIDTSRFVRELLTKHGCTSADVELALKSVILIKNIIDSSGNKTAGTTKSELKRLEYRLNTVILSLEKAVNKGVNAVSPSVLEDFEEIIDGFLDINSKL